MSRPIDRDTVRHIAKLSRLNLSDAELDTAAVQLGRVLDYFRRLDAVDTAEVEPLDHPLPIFAPLRIDEPSDSLTADAALANAPEREQSFFRVPKVIDQTGEVAPPQ